MDSGPVMDVNHPYTNPRIIELVAVRRFNVDLPDKFKNEADFNRKVKNHWLSTKYLVFIKYMYRNIKATELGGTF